MNNELQQFRDLLNEFNIPFEDLGDTLKIDITTNGWKLAGENKMCHDRYMALCNETKGKIFHKGSLSLNGQGYQYIKSIQ